MLWAMGACFAVSIVAQIVVAIASPKDADKMGSYPASFAHRKPM